MSLANSTAAFSYLEAFSTTATRTSTTTTPTTPLPIGISVDDLGLGSWLLIVIMGFMSVLTIAGNLIVLLSYYLDKNIRQPSNYFIFSLAISDLVGDIQMFFYGREGN
jgi:muscarinic acetylcholine receptor